MAAVGIAAGVAHAPRRAHGLGLAGFHLGKAVHPAGRDPVRGAGVDHLRAVRAQLVDQRHGLLGRIVGQAEHDQVDLAHQARAGGGVLALVGGDALHLEARKAGDPAPDLEARGAGLPVDEDGRAWSWPCLVGPWPWSWRWPSASTTQPWLSWWSWRCSSREREQKSRAQGAAVRRTNARSAVIAPARGACVGVGPAMPVASSASSWALLWGAPPACQPRRAVLPRERRIFGAVTLLRTVASADNPGLLGFANMT